MTIKGEFEIITGPRKLTKSCYFWRHYRDLRWNQIKTIEENALHSLQRGAIENLYGFLT